MPFNGSGVYSAPSLPGSWNPATSGSTASPADWNTLLTDLQTALSNAICKDGQTTVMTDLPMATRKHTGVGNASARDQYAAMGQVQDGTMFYVAAGGAADAITLTLAPVVTAYALGQTFRFKASAANTTTTPTAAVNGLTAGTIVWPDGSALAAGDIPAAAIIEISCAALAAGTPTWDLLTVSHPPIPAAMLTTRGDLVVRGASVAQRLGLGANGQVLTSNGTDAVWAALPAAPVYPAVRQTVTGPVDTSGLPTFLPATSGALSITTQNVSGSAPLVASAANGWSATTGSPVDAIGYSAANLTWGSLANNTTNYLYGTISGGIITPASATLAPIYQWGGTPSTTSGQITFNISEMKAYLGNGTTAPQTNLVAFGEVVTSGGSVTNTAAYAYNGLYDGPFTATLPSTSTAATASHNLGVKPRVAKFVMECVTPENGFAVGDQVTEGLSMQDAGATIASMNVWSNTKSAGIVTGNGGSGQFLYWSRSSPGNRAGATLANWKYKFIATRGW